MQRIMNNPDNIVDEMLKGFLKAHSDIVEATDNGRVVKAKNIPERTFLSKPSRRYNVCSFLWCNVSNGNDGK